MIPEQSRSADRKQLSPSRVIDLLSQRFDRIEGGKKDGSVAVMKKIARALEVDLDDLV